MNKITDQELTNLRELNQSISQLKGSISDNFIKAIASYQRVMSTASELNKLNDQIESKYGQVDINLETGEYVNQKDSSGS